MKSNGRRGIQGTKKKFNVKPQERQLAIFRTVTIRERERESEGEKEDERDPTSEI